MPRATASALLVIATAAGAPCPARADRPTTAAASVSKGGDDIVTLRDGSRVRGRIDARRADATCEIILPTGEVRTLGMAEIASVDSPTPPTPPPALAPVVVDLAPPLTTQPLPGRVPLVLEGVGGALPVHPPPGTAIVVDERDSTHGTPLDVPLCRTPCTLYAHPGPVTVWSGGEGRRTDQQTIMVDPMGTRLRLRSSSAAAFNGGIALLASGIAGVVGGMLLAGFALMLNHFATPDGDGEITAGLVAVGAGTVLIGGGVPLMALNSVGVVSRTPLDPRLGVGRSGPPWRLVVVPAERGGVLSARWVF